MNSIAFAVIVLVVLGLAGGIILVLASKFMAVYEDPRIAQITALLYIHPHLVTDPEMRQDAYRELREVVDGRMPLRGVYFAGNALLRDCYRLLKREMDAWCR